MKETKTLGVLGGIGPLASVYFTDLIVNMTEAEKDQEHLPLFMYNDVFIPDRTDYILGKSDVNPLPYIVEGIGILEKVGCDYAAMTCNTAHYFYDEIQKSVNIPVINMVEAAVEYAKDQISSVRKIGILATDGTVKSGVYEKVIKKHGLECEVPSDENQKEVMNIIYNQVKAGNKVNLYGFMNIIEELRDKGCDAIILGCTELSVINKDFNLSMESHDIIDAMQALARKCITLCGKKIKE